MISRLESFITHIEKIKASPYIWFLTLLSITLSRSLFEGILDPPHRISVPQIFLIGYPLSFFCFFFSTWLILKVLTKENAWKIAKVLVIVWVLVAVPPIIDFIESGGQGRIITFFLGDSQFLVNNFVNFGLSSEGTTFGMIIEIVGIIIAITGYVFIKTRNYFKSLAAMVLMYLTAYFWASIPSLIYLVFSDFLPTLEPVGQFSYMVGKHIGFGIISAVSLLLIFFMFLLLLRLENKKLFNSLFRTAKPIHSLNYSLAVVFGILMGLGVSVTVPAQKLIVFSVSQFVSVLLALQSAVLFNRYFDLQNSEKSPQKGGSDTISADKDLLALFSIIFFGFALLLASTVNYIAFMMVFMFVALLFLYSAPPLRLKRLPIISPLTMALCTLLAAVSSYSIFAGVNAIVVFPFEASASILIIFTIIFSLVKY